MSRIPTTDFSKILNPDHKEVSKQRIKIPMDVVFLWKGEEEQKEVINGEVSLNVENSDNIHEQN